jgi:uncharacterized protein YjbI with pentapeptide repeats
MPNEQQLAILRQGAPVWNAWRKENPSVAIDLYKADLRETNLHKAKLNGVNLREANLHKADLSGSNLIGVTLINANLTGADLSGAVLYTAELIGADLREATLHKAKLNEANLREANLSKADLRKISLMKSKVSEANLSGADLTEAKLSEANFRAADLRGANLRRADLSKSNLSNANLSGADLSEANLTEARLRETDLSLANLSGANLTIATMLRVNLPGARLNNCTVYGISVWDSNLKDAEQANLIITPSDRPVITVDNLKIAQFIYLLLNNEEIREVIDTITSKVVLILGRFTPERMAVLDAIRGQLRSRGFAPVLFDFDKPKSKDVTGTVETLARMARFIIADLTDPSSIPHELATTVPFLRTTPVQPVRLAGSGGYSMFDDLRRAYSWVLPTYEYQDILSLSTDFAQLIAPADKMAEGFRKL